MMGMIYFSFLLAFSNIQVTLKFILNTITATDPTFFVDAYTGILSIFSVTAVLTPFTSPLTNKLGPRPMMIIATVCLLFYGLQFFFLGNEVYILGCVICGMGTAFIWIAQGRFVAQNSTDKNIARNVALFITLSTSQMLVGNLYLYFSHPDVNIRDHKRYEIYGVSTAFFGTAVLCACCLLKAKYNVPAKETLKESFVNLFSLLKRKDVWLLVPSMMYINVINGMVSFHLNGIVFTERIQGTPSPIRKIAENSLVYGVCSTITGTLLVVFDKEITKHYHFPVVICAYSMHVIGLVLDFLNLPDSSIHQKTWDYAIIESNYILALCTSAVYGLSGPAIMSRKDAMLLHLCRDNIAHAHAISRLFVSVGAVIPMGLVHVVGLYWMTLVTAVAGLTAVGCFCVCEIDYRSKLKLKRAAEEFAKTKPEEEHSKTKPEERTKTELELERTRLKLEEELTRAKLDEERSRRKARQDRT